MTAAGAKAFFVDLAARLIAKLPETIHAAVKQKREKDLATVEAAAERVEARDRASGGAP